MTRNLKIPRPAPVLSKLLLFAMSTVMSLVLLEGGLRLFGVRAAGYEDVRTQFYRHDAELGWFPRPNSSGQFHDQSSTSVSHNSWGFRDIEHAATKDRPRVAVIGDSFVWGYDIEQEEVFTQLLRDRFPGLDFWNLGVSGYGTDQEFLLLQRMFERVAPSFVIWVFTPRNDFAESSANIKYNFYFKPYFEVDGDGALLLRGVPVPRLWTYIDYPFPLSLFERTALRTKLVPAERSLRQRIVPNPVRAILRAVKGYLQERNVPWMLGYTDQSKRLNSVLQELAIPSVSLVTSHQYPGVGHWTAEGHELAAQRLAEELSIRGWK